MKKLQIDKQELYDLLSSTSKFFPKKTTTPILDCYKIDVVETAIKVTVSSMDASIERVAPIMAFAKFSMCIDKDILPIVQKMPNGMITLTLNDTFLTVSSEKATFTLATKDVTQYPPLPKTEEADGIKMKASELEDMLKSVEYAVSENETAQKALTAVNLKVENGNLQFTALDGHRIALKKKVIGSDMTVDLNVPPMSKYLKFLDGEEDISILWDSHRMVLRSSDCKIVCRLIEGQYANTSRFLKCDEYCTATVDREPLLESLERAALIARTNGNKKPLMMELVNDVMVLQMEEAKGKFQEMMNIQKTGSDLQVAFNVSFLIEAISKITDKTVKLLFSGRKSPMLIKNGVEEDNYTHLILPMNTK